jgi:Uma2 family endonuclease
MPSATLMPPSAPRDQGKYYEIVKGKRKETPPMGALAGTLAGFLVGLINAFAMPRKLGIAVVEVLFHLQPIGSSRRPDVAFVAADRWPFTRDTDKDPAELDTAPNLAVEFISPNNTAAETETKIQDYFDAGVELVWVFYPLQRRVHVFETPDSCRILKDSATLDGGKVLPGFELKLSSFFDSVVQAK